MDEKYVLNSYINGIDELISYKKFEDYIGGPK